MNFNSIREQVGRHHVHRVGQKRIKISSKECFKSYYESLMGLKLASRENEIDILFIMVDELNLSLVSLQKH